MKYSYVLTEEDLKEACYKSVFALNSFKRKRIILSLFYPLLIYLILFRQNTFVLTTFSYCFLVIFIYFYFYQKMLFKSKKRYLNKGEKWQDHVSTEVTEEYLFICHDGIERRVRWENIITFYETPKNIILYLSPNRLEFMVIKKEVFPQRKEDKKYFSFLKKKLKHINNNH